MMGLLSDTFQILVTHNWVTSIILNSKGTVGVKSIETTNTKT